MLWIPIWKEQDSSVNRNDLQERVVIGLSSVCVRVSAHVSDYISRVEDSDTH